MPLIENWIWRITASTPRGHRGKRAKRAAFAVNAKRLRAHFAAMAMRGQALRAIADKVCGIGESGGE